MADPNFYANHGPFSVKHIASKIGCDLPPDLSTEMLIADIASLSAAGPSQLSFCGSLSYQDQLQETNAGFCLVTLETLALVPTHTVGLVCADPQSAFSAITALFYPPITSDGTRSPGAHIDPSARLDETVEVGAGAVIGPQVSLGRGTIIGANVTIGPGVKIGRDCLISANVTVQYALIGDRVTLHPGVRVGNDGFGFIASSSGHGRIAQLGRVILQDDVDIGANTAVDRGTAEDTVIGEGTKIDNLGQIAHNCKIGRHCLIAGKVGMSGSTILGDFVVLGGEVAFAGHLTVGEGAIIAARAGVTKSLEANGTYAGFPAKPVAQWRREVASLSKLARKQNKNLKS